MCQQLEHLPLDDFVDDLLDDERPLAFADHVRECSTCAAHVEALRETRNLLQQAKQITVSPRFDQQLDAQVRRDDLKREGIKLLALGLAAMAALLRPLLARPGSRGNSATSTPPDKEGRQTNLGR